MLHCCNIACECVKPESINDKMSLLIQYVFSRSFLYQTLVTLSTILVVRVALLLRTRAKRFKLFQEYAIPTPKASLWDGHANYLVANFEQAQKQFIAKYGKVFALFIGDYPELYVYDLDKLKKIFIDDNGKSFKERTFTYLNFPLNESILLARHDKWKFTRRIMLPHFSNYRIRNTSYTQFIEETIRKLIFYIDNKFDDNKLDDGTLVSKRCEVSIDVIKLMKAATLLIISNLTVKIPDVQVSEQDEYVEALDSLLVSNGEGVSHLALALPILTPIVNFIVNNFEHDKTTAQISRGLSKIIEEKRFKKSAYKTQNDASKTNSTNNASLIDLLIELYKQGKMSSRQVLGNVEAILIAGYDTTSTTLTYTFWALAKHPHIQDRLREELKAHGIESQYLDQALNESMRLYPAVLTFASRMSTETVDIDGLVIPKGVSVVYNALLIYRDAEIWPEPMKFDPERFNPDVERHPCSFAPFGFGERKCLGYNLALLVVKSILCDVLLRYKVGLISPNELELTIYSFVLSKPKHKVLLSFERLN